MPGRTIAAGTPESSGASPKCVRPTSVAARCRAAPEPCPCPPGRACSPPSPSRPGYSGVPVLDGIAFEVGELVTMLGANGAGKSTTMRALTWPASACISFLINLVGAGYCRRSRAPQSLRSEGRQVFSELSVRDNLLLGAHSRTL